MQHPKTRGGTTRSDTKPRTSGPKTGQRAPTSEKQLARLQEELKKTKDQLRESESRTKTAHQEAEEAKKQLSVMSAKYAESQNQLNELWACEDSRIQELRKISQDRDRAWESELKAVQKHLATAINENQNLKCRLQKLAESESAQAEVRKLKIQLKESKDSELESALAAGVEMESELKRLKVQTEQWRKAAAAMVLGDGGGKFLDSFDFNVVGEKSSSEDTEDETSVKKTNNMLKKIGVLLKKGRK